MGFEALKIGFEILETSFEAGHGQRGLRHLRPARLLGLVGYKFFFSPSNLVWLFLLSFLTFFLNL